MSRTKIPKVTTNAHAVSVRIPPVRDPFINTPLLRLTPGTNGLDRFWISTWNNAFGCLGVCIDEAGSCRVYRFGDVRHAGFYSAIQADDDTLWLCGSLDRVVRLRLSTGVFDEFPTGASSALVFAGMAYDAAAGKLFAVAFPPKGTEAFSFDIRKRRAARVHDVPTLDHYMRFSFPNGDGTHTVVLQCPGLTFLRWDPRDESIGLRQVGHELDSHGDGEFTYRMISDDAGRYYVPQRGWYNPGTGRFGRGPRPEKDDVPWFARHGDAAFGGARAEQGVLRWDMTTGGVSPLFSMAGAGLINTNVTRSGKVVCVNKDGIFARHDGRTGELELSKRLATDSVQPVDCVLRLDRERVLGTPFITQRFWEANLRTGKGFDCGAAAPGGGEILQVWKLRDLAYMAAYTGGELMEYDPAAHPHFPENPRVVAKPPTGMRPIAAADNGRDIFYSCSHHYGHLGSVLTKYDTATGEALYRDDPLPNQKIGHLFYDRRTDSLLAGTSREADCNSCPAVDDGAWLARISAADLSVIEKTPGPEGQDGLAIHGPLGRGRWLGSCRGPRPVGGWGVSWFVFDERGLGRAPTWTLQTLPEWRGTACYAGRSGLFVLDVGPRLELWDMRVPSRLKVLADSHHICRFTVQGRDVLFWTAWEIFVLEGALKSVP